MYSVYNCRRNAPGCADLSLLTRLTRLHTNTVVHTGVHLATGNRLHTCTGLQTGIRLYLYALGMLTVCKMSLEINIKSLKYSITNAKYGFC